MFLKERLPEITPFVPDVHAERRREVINLLRNPAKWPCGFEWNFESCTSCALGLAFKAFRQSSGPEIQNVAPTLGLSLEDADRIFAPTGDDVYGVPRASVTPDMVADHLEQLHRQLER